MHVTAQFVREGINLGSHVDGQHAELVSRSAPLNTLPSLSTAGRAIVCTLHAHVRHSLTTDVTHIREHIQQNAVHCVPL